jgi:hypothetical protein
MAHAVDDIPCVESATLSTLRRYVGGLSRPSKMPGHAYSLPAVECATGSRLVQVPGSVCHDCYALKGRYRFPQVQSALYARLAAITRAQWIDVMTELIQRTGDDYFRWHDSGDLQSVEHFAHICEVARRTPNVRHWIPTREYRTVNDYCASGGTIPPNLAVRLSAHMVDSPPPTGDLPTSTVHTATAPQGSHVCPAPLQGNSCGDCRACWDPAVPNVSYHKH